jgi:hypothetical protein
MKIKRILLKNAVFLAYFNDNLGLLPLAGRHSFAQRLDGDIDLEVGQSYRVFTRGHLLRGPQMTQLPPVHTRK